MKKQDQSLFKVAGVFWLSGLLVLVNADPAPAQNLGQDFGRFMTTTEERSQLEAVRNAQTVPVVATEEPETVSQDKAAAPKPSPGAITVKGLVYRSKGKSTAWINDGSAYESAAGSDYVGLAGADIAADGLNLELPGYEAKIKLKVGQSLEPETGRLRDLTDNAAVPSPGPPTAEEPRHETE